MSFNLGGVVSEGPITLAQLTGTANTGLFGNIGLLTCTSAGVQGTWSGVTMAIIADLFDGFVHFERNWQVAQPSDWDVITFDLPAS